MVRIIGFQERQREDGTSFNVLVLQGGIEPVISQSTGNMYFTAKKATIPSTFDEDTCKALIGTDMEGQIVKEECTPYVYTIQETGEEITLTHRYIYQQEEVVKLPSSANNIVPEDFTSTGKVIEAFS